MKKIVIGLIAVLLALLGIVFYQRQDVLATFSALVQGKEYETGVFRLEIPPSTQKVQGIFQPRIELPPVALDLNWQGQKRHYTVKGIIARRDFWGKEGVSLELPERPFPALDLFLRGGRIRLSESGQVQHFSCEDLLIKSTHEKLPWLRIEGLQIDYEESVSFFPNNLSLSIAALSRLQEKPLQHAAGIEHKKTSDQSSQLVSVKSNDHLNGSSPEREISEYRLSALRFDFTSREIKPLQVQWFVSSSSKGGQYPLSQDTSIQVGPWAFAAQGLMKKGDQKTSNEFRDALLTLGIDFFSRSASLQEKSQEAERLGKYFDRFEFRPERSKMEWDYFTLIQSKTGLQNKSKIHIEKLFWNNVYRTAATTRPLLDAKAERSFFAEQHFQADEIEWFLGENMQGKAKKIFSTGVSEYRSSWGKRFAQSLKNQQLALSFFMSYPQQNLQANAKSTQVESLLAIGEKSEEAANSFSLRYLLATFLQNQGESKIIKIDKKYRIDIVSLDFADLKTEHQNMKLHFQIDEQTLTFNMSHVLRLSSQLEGFSQTLNVRNSWKIPFWKNISQFFKAKHTQAYSFHQESTDSELLKLFEGHVMALSEGEKPLTEFVLQNDEKKFRFAFKVQPHFLIELLSLLSSSSQSAELFLHELYHAQTGWIELDIKNFVALDAMLEKFHYGKIMSDYLKTIIPESSLEFDRSDKNISIVIPFVPKNDERPKFLFHE